MASELVSSDLLVDLFSHRPANYLEGVIDLPAAKTTILDRKKAPISSSLGGFDRLPTEVTWMILNDLDFLSLYNLSRSSWHWLTTVENLPAYAKIVENAPHLLPALHKTECIQYQSAGALLRALYTEKCARCPKYGNFLNILTCERCCDQCCCFDLSFCVAPATMLCALLGLKKSDIKKLPKMHTILGNFKVADGLPTSRRQRLRVVSVAQALSVAKKVHGLDETKKWAFTSRGVPPSEVSEAELEQWRESHKYGRGAAQHVLRTDTENFELRRALSNTYCGSLAAISFPSINPEGYVQEGYWCTGCYYAHSGVLSRPDGDDGAVGSYLMRKPRGARGHQSEWRFECYSRDGLLEHLPKCLGAKSRLPDLSIHKVHGQKKCDIKWTVRKHDHTVQ